VVLRRGANGIAFGNVIVIGEHLEGIYTDYVMAHERIHLAQFRALGWAMWPAQFFVHIEPPKGITTDWNDPTQPGRTMWQPPDWWPNQWSFVTFSWKI